MAVKHTGTHRMGRQHPPTHAGQHAISQVPSGTWTDSVEQTFWAHVKTGEEPETVAARLVKEINERSQA